MYIYECSMVYNKSPLNATQFHNFISFLRNAFLLIFLKYKHSSSLSKQTNTGLCTILFH